MIEEISKEELAYMQTDDPVAAALVRKWIEDGKTTLSGITACSPAQ